MNCPWSGDIQQKIRANLARFGNFKCRRLGDINRDALSELEFRAVVERVLSPLLGGAECCEVFGTSGQTSANENMDARFFRRENRKLFINQTADLAEIEDFWRHTDRLAGDVVFKIDPNWVGWADFYRNLWDPKSVTNPGAALSRSGITAIKKSLDESDHVFVCLPAVNSRSMIFTFARPQRLLGLFDRAVNQCSFWNG